MSHGVTSVTVAVMIVPLHISKGTRKPNLGGRRVGRLHTRQETRNIGLKAITDKSGPVPIQFEFDDRETLMPLGDHAAHWANYLGELVREFPLHYPAKCHRSERRGSWQRLGPSLTCVLTWNPTAGHKSMRASRCKRSTMAKRLLSKKDIGFLKRTGVMTWSASDANVPRTFLRQIGMSSLH
nr:hypothetical protein [Tanacetum cinerariifolium]